MVLPIFDELTHSLCVNAEHRLEFPVPALAHAKAQAQALSEHAQLHALLVEFVGFAGFLGGPRQAPLAGAQLLQLVDELAASLEVLAQQDPSLQTGATDLRRQLARQRAALDARSSFESGISPKSASGIGLRQKR